MSVCTFFGHRECYGLSRERLYQTIENLINQGVDTFYVGNHGQFDAMVYGCLKQLRRSYPHIRCSVVLAYLPACQEEAEDSIYPEGMELGPPRFAIERRNKWMIEFSDYCVCYVNRKWGGAYRFVRLAIRRGLTVINLGNEEK